MKTTWMTWVGLLCGFFACADAAEIRGVVWTAQSEPAAQVMVILCDQATGIPLDRENFEPFTEHGPHLQGLATTLTDESGGFVFTEVPDGCYRLVAQGWQETPGASKLFEKNGKTLQLYGTAEKVAVPSAQAGHLDIHPLGSGTVVLDEDFPNSDALLLVSTAAPAFDPVLGFICWRGPFLQHVLGANRMPYGVTCIQGLPAGRIHLSVFANDSAGGIGTGYAEVKGQDTVQAEYIPIVCTWSNGRHHPPEALRPTFMEVKEIVTHGPKPEGPWLDELLAQKGIAVEHDEKARNPLGVYYPYLNETLALPSGREVRLADILASLQYLNLQRAVERRNQGPPSN